MPAPYFCHSPSCMIFSAELVAASRSTRLAGSPVAMRELLGTGVISLPIPEVICAPFGTGVDC